MELPSLNQGLDGASTHEIIAEKLRQRRAASTGVDVKTLQPVEHEPLGEIFFPGPLSYDKYNKLFQIRRMEDLQHIQNNKSEEDPRDTSRSDLFLLSNAVYTVDGKPLGDEMAKELLSLPGSGVPNHILISEADKCNPPRHHLAYDVLIMLNAKKCELVLWRLIFEAGLIPCLINAMSSLSSPEEREQAEMQLRKAEEVMYALYPMFEADDAARNMGITFEKGINLLASHDGDLDAVMATANSLGGEATKDLLQP